MTEQQRINLSISHKGNIPWNKGKKGVMPTPWNKGKVFEKVRVIKKCAKCGIDFKVMPCEFIKRVYCSNKCSYESKIGKPPWSKGLKGMFKHSEEFKNKMSERMKGTSPTIEARRKSSESQTAEKNHSWKGGRYINSGGYVLVYCKNHPHIKGRYVMEHRIIMEKILGRYLDPNEIVHHINGIKTDNRPENLKLAIRKAHFGQVRCPHCLKEFLIK